MRNRIGKGLLATLGAGALAISVGTALGQQGDLDTTFSGDGKLVFDPANGQGHAVAVDSESRIYEVGTFDPPAADAGDFAVARFNPDGSPDTTFSGDGLATVDLPGADADVNQANGVAINSSGQVLLGGTDGAAADSKAAVARLTSAGSLDTSYGTGGVATLNPSGGADTINDIALDGNGKVAAGGTSSDDFLVALFTTAGAPDPTYAGGAGFATLNVNSVASSDQGEGVAIDSAGRVVVAGTTSLVAGEENFAVARWTSAGVLDATFSNDVPTPGRYIETGMASNATGADAADHGQAVAIGANDRVIVAGDAQRTGLGYEAALLALNSTGAPDTGFSGDAKAYVGVSGSADDKALDVANDGQGKFVVAGVSDPGGSDSQFLVARFKDDGNPDTSFSNGGMVTTDVGAGDDQGESVALDPKTRRIVAGGWEGAPATADFALARYEGVPRCKGKVPTLAGTMKLDKINGSKKADIIWGGVGNDQLKGFKGKDFICGDDGNDVIKGGKGNDTLLGNKGNDKISGGKGRDVLLGGPGKDTLGGGPGRDKLKGGPGKDIVKQGGIGGKKKKGKKKK